MAHHKRRPTRAFSSALALSFCVLAALRVACAPSSVGEPPFSSYPSVVHGTEHIGWSEAGAGDFAYQFLAYVDGTPRGLPDAACRRNLHGQLDCTASLPSMTAGPHRLHLTAVRAANGGSGESAKSAPLDILVQPLGSGSTSATNTIRSFDRNSQIGTPLAARAAGGTATLRLDLQTLMSALDGPSTLAITPDGRVFLVERTGNVRVWSAGAAQFPVTATIAGAVPASGFGMAVDPGFAANHQLYVAYTFQSAGALENRIVRFREVNGSLGEAATIFADPVSTPPSAAPRIAFGPDGKLYAVFPAAGRTSEAAYAGKVLRLNADGTTPRDNPVPSPVFLGREGTAFAFSWQPGTNRFWDEYRDWQDQSVVGRKDAGSDGVTPVRVLSASIEPSGMAFIGPGTNALYPGDLFIATRSGEGLLHLTIDPSDPTQVVAVETLMNGGLGRVSAVAAAPDGSLYVCTDNRGGSGAAAGEDRLLRLFPTH